MANHKQAIKRHRQSLGRADRNAYYKATMRTLLKRARTSLEGAKKQKDAVEAVKSAVSYVDHVATRGAIPKTRANRLKSRLSSQLAALK